MHSNKRRISTVFRPLVNAIARLFVSLRLSPNSITILGALLATITPLFMESGEYILLGVTIFLVGLLDGVDGTMARITKRTTKWGGFLDSTLDRYGDCIILIGYLLSPTMAPLGQVEVLGFQFRVWVCVSIIGSLMVSYSRAKSEAIGVKDCNVGIAARSERLLILSVTAALGAVNEYIMIYGLIVTSVLANATALQRIAHTYETLRSAEKRSKGH
jgi:phosphatidylglycerophosphate synthase